MKFSIIIPVYNVKPYLRECLDSVLSQTYFDWEAICVDDGSTDGCAAILDEYAEKDKRFRVVHQQNAGVGNARNTALNIASGDWILSLDSDDIFYRDTLQLIFNGLKERNDNDIDIVRFGFTCFSPDGHPDWTSNYDDFSSNRENGTLLDFTRSVDTRCLNSLNVLHAYRSELLRTIRFKNYKNGEDVVFQTDAVVHAQYMLTINKACYGYRCGRTGSACTTKINDKMTYRRVYDDIWSSYDALEILAKCNKRHDGIRIHWLVVGMTEGAVYNIMRLSGNDQKRAWQEWYKAMAMTRGDILPILSRYAQIIIMLNSILPLHIFACITCALPYYLKQHGIHR